MSTTGPMTLTQLALSLQARTQKFNGDLTSAAMRAATDPAGALAEFDRCWSEIDPLEQAELDFQAKMGMQPNSAWNDNRLQISIGRAQVLLLLGRYDEAVSAITQGRSYIASADHPVAAILDELEVMVLQARS